MIQVSISSSIFVGEKGKNLIIVMVCLNNNRVIIVMVALENEHEKWKLSGSIELLLHICALTLRHHYRART